MAKQVEDILLRLGISGFEGLDRVKSSFRDLGRVTNLAERDILKARDSLTEFAKKAGDTEAVNKGLIEAFKGLRSQVDVNSATYRNFTNEITRLETELRGSTAAIDRQRLSLLNNAAAGKQNVDSLQRQVDALRQLQRETRPGSSAFLQLGKDIDNVTIKLGKLKSEAQAFNLALGQQAGATPEVLNRQIATLQKGLQSVRYDAEQFVDTLRKIQLLQITQTGRAGRAGVIAGFEAFRSREYTAGFADPSRLAAMPDTTAALNQELAELSLRLDNVERGSVDYINTSVRIADIQKRLRTELLGTAEAFSRLDIAQAGVERRAGKLANIQEYYRSQGPMAPGVGGFRDPETGAIIARGTRVQTGIRPGTQYGQPIGPVAFPAAAVQAEASIKQAQERINDIYENAYIRRTQLQTDYNQIHIDKLLEGLDMEGRVRDRAFNDELVDFDRRLAARERRRRGRLTGMQLAQGVGAALSGGIFGGPEGLLGGLGGLALGGVGGAFAGAAAGAQVGMFRQQLAGTADYAAQIGKLQIALRGIVGSQDAYNRAIAAAAAATRDLNIPQEEATRGLTRLSAAVIGAGGTVNDSAFAFRAMSEAVKATGGNAEQVDGALLALTQVFSKGKVSAEELNQIAERLPGTFTLFAQAAGKSGPELQKALEQGTIGLNDLMKFLDLLSKRYETSASTIAKSSEDAGARLRVAFDAMRLDVGKALQPLGAELQNAFTSFIVDITPALIYGAKGVASAISGMYRGIEAGFNLLKDMRGLIDGLAKSMLVFGGITAGVFVASNITTFIGAIKNLYGVLRSLLTIQRLLLSVEAARAGMLAIIAGLEAGATKGKIIGAILGGAAGIAGVIGIGKLVETIVNDVTAGVDKAVADVGKGALSQFPEPKSDKQTDKESKARQKEEARQRKDLFNELLDQLNAQNKVLAQQGRLNESIAETESAKAAAALLTAQDILRNEQAQLDLRLKFGEISKRVYSEQQQAIRLEGQVVRQEFDKTVKKLQEEADSLLRGLTGPGGAAAPTESPFQRASRELTEEIQRRQARAAQIGGLRGERASQGLAAIDVREAATRTVLGDEATGLEAQIRDLQRAGRELSTLDQLKEKYLQDWDSLDPKLKQQLSTLAAQKDALTRQKESLSQLKQLYADIGMSIKDGVVGAIQGAIDGTKSLQQVATDLLNSIANKLLDVAVNMALFGVMSGTGTGGGLLGGLFKSANGSAYASNKIVPYAMGGLVTKPTLFRYANGGVPATGLMGEAGPEAIMPLRRLPNGRLGVESSAGNAPININVSVDAKGTSVEGNEGQGKALAAVISAGVQAEIVKQQRPGGLLNR